MVGPETTAVVTVLEDCEEELGIWGWRDGRDVEEEGCDKSGGLEEGAMASIEAVMAQLLAVKMVNMH